MATRILQNGRYGIHLKIINKNGEIISNPDSIVSSQLNYYSGGLISTFNKGFADVLVIENPNGLNKYGIAKYDSTGHLFLKSTSQDSFLYISLKEILETTEGNFILVGTEQLSIDSQGGTQDIVLIKTDSLGNELWRKTYGNTINFEQGYSVAATPDGGYIIGGLRSVPGTIPSWLEDRPYVIKTDSVGNVEWDRVYGAIDTTNLPAYDIITTQDGGYAFVGGLGMEKFTGYDPQFPWIVKLNNMGDVLWSQTSKEGHAASSSSVFRSVVELTDGSFVTCGSHVRLNLDTINFKDKYSSMGIIAKYSANGDSIWSRNFVHPENLQSPWSDHYLLSIAQTPDGGFAAAGYLLPSPPDTGTQDTWVVKVDSFGCLEPGCEVNSVPKIESSIASLKIYPNPASEILNVEIIPTYSNQEFVFELYDILGKRVLSETLQPNQNTINIQHLPSGVYTYKIGEVWGNIVVE